LFFWSVLALIGLVSCGVPGIPKPPSLDLAQPVTDLRAARKGNKVFLFWTAPTETTDNLPLRHPGGTVICRDPGKMRPGCAGGLLEGPPPSQPAPSGAQRTFVDTLPGSLLGKDPAAEIFYGISLFNQNNRTAGLSNVVSVPAIVAPPAPEDLYAQVRPDGVSLVWVEIPRGAEIPEVHHLYRVYRREQGSTADTLVGELPLGSTPTTELVDRNFEWEKTYFYRVTVVTAIQAEKKAEAQFEGDDTEPLRVVVHDTFPPAVPTGLQAVFSGVGQQPFVDLSWAPDTDADLAGYNIYRREGGSAEKINAEVIKAPAFRDTNVASGHTYFYSVSAVDVRGNESSHSEETSESAP
jgi:hypothetical protein